MGEKLMLGTESISLLAIAEWVKHTCLMSGSSIYTAYKVAGIFVEALENPTPSRGEGGEL